MNLDAPPVPATSNPAAPNNDATLSSAIAQLQQQLKVAFSPALQGRSSTSYDTTLLHPLSVSASKQISLPHELLSTTLSSFEANLLNSGTTTAATPSLAGNGLDGVPVNPGVSTNERLRLLALMKEQSTLNLQDLSLKDGLEASRKILERRREYKQSFPVSTGNGNVQSILEGIAKECGLEIFAGAEEGAPSDEAGLGDNMDTDMDVTMKKSTVTMAGKGMVLDLDIEVPSSITSSISEQSNSQVTGVRFSYGLEGSTDTGIDRLLSRQAKNKKWEAFGDSLMSLAKLDSLVVVPSESQMEIATALDPFGAMKSLGLQVQSVFSSELEVASSPRYLFTTGHGLPILNQNTPYLTLIYHLPALSFFTEEWDEAVASGFQNEQIARLAGLEGCKSLAFEVEESKDDTMQVAKAAESSFPLLRTASNAAGVPEGLEMRLGEGVTMVAKLNEPVWIPQATGRKLQASLNGRQEDFAKVPASTTVSSTLVRLESFLVPYIMPGKTYEIAVPGCPPIRVALSAPTDSQAYQIREFRFNNAGQLLASLEVLRMQCLFNELLSNTMEGAGREVEKEDESTVKLEDLFSDEPQPNISLSLQANLSDYPPALEASFSIPNLPGWLPVTLHLDIICDPTRHSGYRIAYSLQGCNNDKLHERLTNLIEGDAGKDKMEAILAKSRDVKMVVRWLSMRMQTAGQDVWKGAVDKPAWSM